MRVASLCILCLVLIACSDDAPENVQAGDGGVDVGVDLPEADATDEPDTNTPPDIPTIEEDVEDFVPACGLEDSLAPNQGPAEAHEIDTDFSAQDLLLCAGTSDWFAFDLVEGESLLVALDFDPEFADLDLHLFRDQTSIAEATTETVERLRYDATESGRVLLEVRGRLGGDVAYELLVKLSCRTDADCPDGRFCSLRQGYCEASEPPECGLDDGYEPNESTSAATPIVFEDGAASVSGIHICTDDEDYYRFELPAGHGLEIDIVHPRGAVVDAVLFGDDGIFRAEGVGDNEKRLYAPYLGAGTFYLVLGQTPGEGGVPTTYRMDMALLDGACEVHDDCRGLPRREFCNAQTGACGGIEGEGQLEFGASCDDSADCVGELEGCYTGSEGGGDNVCTNTCVPGDCDGFGDGAYCLVLNGFRNSGICVPACTQDTDCSVQFRCDTEAGRCVSKHCNIDANCPAEGEDCIHLDAYGGLCLEHDRYQDHDCGVGRGPDAGENGSSSRAAAVEFEDGAVRLEGLETCFEDEDWYVVELLEEANTLAVTVSYPRGLYLDAYVYDEEGNAVGARVDDANPAAFEARYLPAGRYFVRVHQYPIEDAAEAATYTLELTTTASDCRGDEVGCQGTWPLRISCDEETGSCGPFAGDGTVELGGLCDSQDDCSEDAEFCWDRQGGRGGINICTHRCQGDDSDCDDVPGAGCVVFGGRFGVCLPRDE